MSTMVGQQASLSSVADKNTTTNHNTSLSGPTQEQEQKSVSISSSGTSGTSKEMKDDKEDNSKKREIATETSSKDSKLSAAATTEDSKKEGPTSNTKKKQRTEPKNDTSAAEGKSSNKTTTTTTLSLPGFDLELDSSNSKEMIQPSTEGTSEFREADVLSGRGGGTNVHPGNRDFRDLINKYRTVYLKAKKNDKPAISRAIVKEVRSKGGRFLKKNDRDGLYYEIGDWQAREKTSQALRQRAPEMRKLMFEQQAHLGGVPGAIPLAPNAAAGAAGMMSEERFRMAMPLLAANGMNPEFAAGLQAGMGAAFNHPMMAAAAGGNSGALMGAATYNPALLQAMMVGMGGGMHGPQGMGFEAAAAYGTGGGMEGELGGAHNQVRNGGQNQKRSDNGKQGTSNSSGANNTASI